MSVNLLDRITATFGAPRAYDGRFCVWCNEPHDVRDIARRLRVSANDVVDALPEFKPVKRGRATEDASE